MCYFCKQSRGHLATLKKNYKKFPFASLISIVIDLQRYIRGFLVRLNLKKLQDTPARSTYKCIHLKLAVYEKSAHAKRNRLLYERYEHLYNQRKNGALNMETFLQENLERIQARFRNRCVCFRRNEPSIVYQRAALAIQQCYHNYRRRMEIKLGPGVFLRNGKIRYYNIFHDSAAIIQRAWRSFINKEIFKFYKALIRLRERAKPQDILKSVNPAEAALFDAASGVHVRFRLGGINFPPTIYYKIFVHNPLCDVNSFAPRDYTRETPINGKMRHNKGYNLETNPNKEGWYVREENNPWRPLTGPIFPPSTNEEDLEYSGLILKRTKNKEKEYVYSKAENKQVLARKRKLKRFEWLKKVYKKEMESKNQQIPEIDEIDLNDLDDEFEAEVERLLQDMRDLDYEKYINQWTRIGCTLGSDFKYVEIEQPKTVLENPLSTNQHYSHVANVNNPPVNASKHLDLL